MNRAPRIDKARSDELRRSGPDQLRVDPLLASISLRAPS
jgi:hypothetical protein